VSAKASGVEDDQNFNMQYNWARLVMVVFSSPVNKKHLIFCDYGILLLQTNRILYSIQGIFE